LPSNQSPLGALPSRFKRERLLIVGCGDVGQRVARVQRHVRVVALTSSPERMSVLRAHGITPVLGDLDASVSLQRLAGWATRVLHLAPPPLQGHVDPRTHVLTQMLMRRSAPRSVVYGSTSGVYGDCAGVWVSEHRRLNPMTPRAHRRVDAEARVRHLGRLRAGTTRVNVLRIPGIYAPNRENGTPRERLLRCTPVLFSADDVFTNHIHADDLARACQLALWRGRAQRVYHVSDDSELLMGDYVDLAASLYGLPPPPRISRAQARTELPAMQLSFMSESRRLVNTRMKRELRLQLRYAHVRDGLI
jgi:nucleoside-diphosphate-sugar epimerase